MYCKNVFWVRHYFTCVHP